MTKVPQDTDALEERFRRHGISMRHLNPWWVRLFRRMGLRPKPPVLFSLSEHFLWETSAIVAVSTFVYLLFSILNDVSPRLLIVPYALAVILPPINWLIRRRIRARIAE